MEAVSGVARPLHKAGYHGVAKCLFPEDPEARRALKAEDLDGTGLNRYEFGDGYATPPGDDRYGTTPGTPPFSSDNVDKEPMTPPYVDKEPMTLPNVDNESPKASD